VTLGQSPSAEVSEKLVSEREPERPPPPPSELEEPPSDSPPAGLEPEEGTLERAVVLPSLSSLTDEVPSWPDRAPPPDSPAVEFEPPAVPDLEASESLPVR
jgi:hypothetical protein